MGRSQESFNKKEVRKKKEKKRKDKAQKRMEKKESGKSNSLDDMIAYVDENGVITYTPPDPDKKEEIELEDIEVSVPKNDPNQQEDTARKGRVSYFNDSKGFGFIKEDNSRNSLFVHINDVEGEITEGDQVTFVPGKGDRGPVALEVKKIGS